MMGDFVRFLVGTVLLSTFVAAVSGKVHGTGVLLDKEKQELKPALPNVDSVTKGQEASLPDVESVTQGLEPALPALPEVGPATRELRKVAPEVERPVQERRSVEWQNGSSQNMTTVDLGTDTTTPGEDSDFVARFLQQKSDQFKGRRDLQRREDVDHSTVSEADKVTIVDMHNDYRSHVIPTAGLMLKMHWSPKLADSAQQIADECLEGNKHDDAGERRTKSKLGIPVGQNYALGPNGTGWSNVVNAWHAEEQYFVFGVEVSQAVGHYTQEVRGPSSHVGCGSKYCPTLVKDGQPRRAFYCNYAYMNMDYTNPYILGEPCSQCPHHCENGLCNCGDKICEFGGTLNPDTCKCTCKYGFSGDSCTTCPLVDGSSNCGGSWKEESCGVYTNVRDECPCMCGDCEKKCSGDVPRCRNGGVLTEAGDGTCTCGCPAGFTGSLCGCKDGWRADEDNPACPQVGMEYCNYINIRDTDCRFKCNC